MILFDESTQFSSSIQNPVHTELKFSKNELVTELLLYYQVNKGNISNLSE